MNFFEYQEAARRQTSRLILFYLLAVVLIITTLFFVATLLVHYSEASIPNQPFNWGPLWDPQLFGGVALVIGTIIISGSLYKIAALSSGGTAVAEMLNGRPIIPDTTDFQEKRLLNIIEEMAIASGTPIPKVYVMDNESGINAFAAGYSTQDAVIAVTRGALTHLNREELQGVIGHEFSHILNGDMRLNIRLIGVLHGILLIAITGYFLFRILGHASAGSHSSRDDKKGNPLVILVLFGLAMMIIGYIGVFFARLIKSAVSRQREFLADASAVQFTRNPAGLSNALKKIGGLATGSRLAVPSAEAASHLFFANGITAPFLGLLATHPPLKERILRLDPQFKGEFAIPESAGEPENPQFSSLTSAPPAKSPITPPPLSSLEIVDQTGTIPVESFHHAIEALDAIPEVLRAAVHSPTLAQAILYGILLDSKPAIQQQQLAYLASRIPQDQHQSIDQVVDALSTLPPVSRQPLVEIAIGSLKHLPPAQYQAFRETIMTLVAADATVSLFEYMILRMILRHLDTQFGFAKPAKTRLTSFNTLTNEVSTVLSALAWFGADTPPQAEQAFRAGGQVLGIPSLRLLPADSAALDAMDKALDRLVETTPLVKQKLMQACATAIRADGTITPDECDALRAIADALNCPLPRP